MRFATPLWLWGLLSVPLLFVALSFDERSRKIRFSRFISPKLWPVVAPQLDWSLRFRKLKLWLLALAFALLALARPQWGSREEVIKVSGLDLMIVLDVSNSMETEDVPPNRLQKAKHLIRTLVDQLRGDRVGLVAFAGSAYVASPLTTNLEYLMDVIQTIGPKSVTNQGTDIGIALETARKAIDRGAEDTAARGDAVKPSNAVILISDGEDHEAGAVEVARKLKESGAKFYVFGIGTEKGGPIPARDPGGNLVGYKRDRAGQPIVSAFHPEALMQLASLTGGKFWSVSTNEGEISELLADLGALNRTDYAERRQLIHEERYQIPLALCLLFLLLELSVPARRLIVWLVALTAFGLVSQRGAQAAPVGPYLENRKGLKAFEEGKVEEAKKSFGAAQALDPSLPELEYNQGVVQLKEGDVDSAIQAFGEAARKSSGGKGQKEDPRLKGLSLYNLGAALGQKGEVKPAVQAYLNAIEAARQSGDAALENDSRRNLELLIREQEKQKQQKQDQQKQDQQKQDQQKQDQQKQDQSKQDQQKPDPGKPDQKKPDQPPQSYQDKSKDQKGQSFRSMKLSNEDAERVISELKSRERELQNRLRKQHGTQQNSQKDW